MKAKTIKSVVKDTFGGVLGYAASPKRRWIANNPLVDVKLPQDKDVDDRVFLTHQQVADIASAAAVVDKKNSKVSKTLVQFLAYTGLRAMRRLLFGSRMLISRPSASGSAKRSLPIAKGEKQRASLKVAKCEQCLFLSFWSAISSR